MAKATKGMKPGVQGFAEFTPDGRCRLFLKRLWDERKALALYVGLNPSRAGKDTDDMTVTKGMGFARRWGLGGTLHGNAFPYISTNPKELVKCSTGEISLNDQRLLKMAKQASVVVLAWGAYPQYKKRFYEVANLLKPFHPICVGRTKGGYPKHISRIGYDSKRRPW